jgi:prophage antirepressor-like protein
VVILTEELATLFEGKEIRAVEQDGRIWFPLADLCEAWGVHRNTLNQIIERNQKKFDGRHTSLAHVTCAGLIAVDELGLYLLIGAVNSDRLKNPVAAEAILRFQRWVPELIQRYRKKEIVQVQQGPVLETEIRHARTLAEKCGKNPDAFLAIALEKCGDGDYARALQAPAVVHGEPGWYNITQLVGLCNDSLLNPERLNHFLNNRGFQYRDENRLWRLTPAGMEHGKEYLYTSPHQHSEIRVSWRESILYASGLKRPLAENQTALPARAGVS